MSKSIKLYDKTNFSDFFESLISRLDPDTLESGSSVEGLRLEFKNADGEQQYDLLSDLIMDVDPGDLSFLITGDLVEVWIREGGDFWSRVDVSTVTLRWVFDCEKEYFIEINVEELRQNPESGIGVHPSGDIIIAAQKVFKGDVGFLKPHYPEFEVNEKLSKCFCIEQLSRGFTDFIENNTQTVVNFFVDKLSYSTSTLQSLLSELYRNYEIEIYRRALLIELNEAASTKIDNEKMVGGLSYDVINSLIAKHAEPFSMKTLLKAIKKEQI